MKKLILASILVAASFGASAATNAVFTCENGAGFNMVTAGGDFGFIVNNHQYVTSHVQVDKKTPSGEIMHVFAATDADGNIAKIGYTDRMYNESRVMFVSAESPKATACTLLKRKDY